MLNFPVLAEGIKLVVYKILISLNPYLDIQSSALYFFSKYGLVKK